ncbi:sulfotransferase domain-containing protein [Azospirillum sp. ST 5-10]|uniref:sulfotransferase domain-containing protein n=1 Tax=unclassified Azospirillum TaxID=2630922 RepID=UPI003F49FCAC
MKKAVIFGMARSGTNFLQTMIHSHPDAHFHGEIFHPKNAWVNLPDHSIESLGVDVKEWREQSHVRFIEWVYSETPIHDVVGFKIFLGHAKDAIDYIVDSRDIHILFLERENRLAMYSSVEIGKATNIWHTTSPNRKTTSVLFDETEFSSFRAYVDRLTEEMRTRLAGRPNVLFLSYEDLLTPKANTDIVEFLGLSAEFALSSALKKQNPEAPIERFQNRNEVMQYLERIGRVLWAHKG